MALIRCPECGKEISDKSKTCIHCGYPIEQKEEVYYKRTENVHPKTKKDKTWIWIIIGVLVIAFFVCTSGDEKEKETTSDDYETYDEYVESQRVVPEETEYSEPEIPEEEYKALCEEYKYKDVLRNPSDYIGKKIKATVKISSVHEASWLNDGKYYFAYSEDEYGWYGDQYGIFDKRNVQEPKLLEDDIITVYGEIADPEYTTSLIVSSSELLCIDMKYIDFISE